MSRSMDWTREELGRRAAKLRAARAELQQAELQLAEYGGGESEARLQVAQVELRRAERLYRDLRERQNPRGFGAVGY